MQFISQFLTGAAGLLSSCLVRRWMGSLEHKAAHYDPLADIASADRTGHKIYVMWHEYLLFTYYLRGNSSTTLLASRHRDAEILSRVAYHLGFELVRGSTSRYGITALRELLRQKQTNFALACDGPRGPRRSLAAGAVILASKLGLPIVVSGVGFDRPWRLKSWDRLAIPRPGSRARVITSPLISIPDRLDRNELERYRTGVERLLNRLTLEAEHWAEAGTARVEEIAIRLEPALRAFPAESSDTVSRRKAA
jgi:lysophospholipid acyltransferase (LPLAT)-like uncharacterized protein